MTNIASFFNLSISLKTSILDSLKEMDCRKRKLLILCNDKQEYKGLVSIGDIQRAIIKGVDLKTKLDEIEIEKKIVVKNTYSKQAIYEHMQSIRCEFMPVLNNEGKLVDVYFWDKVFKGEPIGYSQLKNIPLVIMAGGRGDRLKPISNLIPKALIPIGKKTIIEEILERFQLAGTNKIIISVNYKKEMIQDYLNKLGKFSNVEYIFEKKPLGTAGSLSLLKGKINTTFYVSNCDVLIEQDLHEIYNYHKLNSNQLTVVIALKNFKIPYGSIVSGKNGLLESIEEKPELTFKINTGIYLLEPSVLDEIPKETFLDLTDLINNVKRRGLRVGVFPLSERSWLDIGEWPEYIKTVRNLSGEDNFKGI